MMAPPTRKPPIMPGSTETTGFNNDSSSTSSTSSGSSSRPQSSYSPQSTLSNDGDVLGAEDEKEISQIRFIMRSTIPVKSATEKTFTAYLVELLDEDNEARTLLKRFRQFVDLNDWVKRTYPKREIPKFPKKKIIGNMKQDFVYKRCRKLENFMNEIIKIPGIIETDFMIQFLEAELVQRGATRRRQSQQSIDVIKAPGSGSKRQSFKSMQSMKAERVSQRITAQVEKPQDELSFASLGLATVPPGIFGKDWTPKLKTLDLGQNQLTKIPKELKQFVSLTSLNLAGNKIEEIDELAPLTTLTFLNLSGNPLGNFPATLCTSLTNLQHLNLSECSILLISDEFENMTSLTFLDMSSNSIQDLPLSLGNLSKLETLRLHDNGLRDLPLSLGMCGSLTSLTVDNNPLIDSGIIEHQKKGEKNLITHLIQRLQGSPPAVKSQMLQQLRKDISAIPAGPAFSGKVSQVPKSSLGPGKMGPPPTTPAKKASGPPTIPMGAPTGAQNVPKKLPLDPKMLPPSPTRAPTPPPAKTVVSPEAPTRPVRSDMTSSQGPTTSSQGPKSTIVPAKNPAVPTKMTPIRPPTKSSLSAGKLAVTPSAPPPAVPAQPALSPPPQSPSTSGISANSQNQLGEKIVVIRKWAVTEIDSSIMVQLEKIQVQLEGATEIEVAKPLAQLLRDLKSSIENASDKNYWIRVQQTITKNQKKGAPPVNADRGTIEGDRLQSLKRIVLVVISDLRLALVALKSVLETSSLPQEIIQLVKVIKELKQRLDRP
eukprot:TRINITY_DN4391_c0_g1_i1.p1 TRINITY_DN4391_c0_g1~~TRINITY_DN4391_c0_g1_i1.p1  ORF type:complete len:851 (-),score=304.76 TRINITY_DN4391_c0_g1_i1:63-2363(-)